MHSIRFSLCSSLLITTSREVIVISFRGEREKSFLLSKEYFDLTTETAQRLKGHDENGKQSVESNQTAIHDLTYTNDSEAWGKFF